MPMFCFFCRDGEQGAMFREHLDAKLHAHFAEHGHHFAVAGPLYKDDRIVGSLLVIKADSEAEARAHLEAVPFYEMGVWQSIRGDRYTPLFGDWA
jgi:hypothetical protein